MTPIVLSLCDRTGNMVQPWLDAGHECWIVDLQHPEGEHRNGNLVTVGADVNDWLPPRREYTAVFAFPPCTHLAISGSRWMKDKGIGALIEGLRAVESCRRICAWSEAPWMIENPVSTISTYWRPPDVTFNPADFGGYIDPPTDAYLKKTCLWVGHGFRLPRKRPVDPVEGSRMHLMAPGPDRADKRSETPRGFAQAVFEELTYVHEEAAS